MPRVESTLEIIDLKAVANAGVRFSTSANTLIAYFGRDRRVGIGTDNPETTLHVNGAITTTGLIVPPGLLGSAVDVASVWGFNPNFDNWTGAIADGWEQVGDGTAVRSADRRLGAYSAQFSANSNISGDEIIWKRSVRFPEPLYANVFIQGSYTYKFNSYDGGEPGLVINLKHRATAVLDGETTNTFIAPTYASHNTSPDAWQTVNWRATTPGGREITELEIQIVTSGESFTITEPHPAFGGGGTAEIIGGTDGTFDWQVDGVSFQFMHPDMRIDQEGRITGAYISYAAIDDLHIKDMISSATSRIYSDDEVLTDGLVANGSFANGWSLSKSGGIKGTEITIYDGTGDILFHRGGFGPTLNLASLDQDADNTLKALPGILAVGNKVDLSANIGYLDSTGTFASNGHAVYFANVVDGSVGTSIGSLANGEIILSGISSNAPPGSIYTGGMATMKNQSGYIMFLANTDKWSTTGGTHADYWNPNLGEYGLYVFGNPTYGGWEFHPHGNTTFYPANSAGFTDNEFIIIGKMYTDENANVSLTTHLTVPEFPDTIAALTSGLGDVSIPVGIQHGGTLFADIHINQYNHAEANGSVQLTNYMNSPNTEFTFIHPGTGNSDDDLIYVCNGSFGIDTNLEDLTQNRFIVFIGTDTDRFDHDVTGLNINAG
ncbi:MAG TPA: hypothetical protein EYN51_03490, partial [Flavobacteriales bacterium]|nr:hypothetical protein [Flavobacteriales bacterium]